MRVLLDTHILLGFFEGNLSDEKRRLIENAESYVSHISLWEIEIKKSLRKLSIPEDFYTVLEQSAFYLLSLTIPHIQRVGTLPFHHRDPFDRMLVAQAQVEKLTLLTDDAQLAGYDVALL